jgi:hypothetical protein
MLSIADPRSAPRPSQPPPPPIRSDSADSSVPAVCAVLEERRHGRTLRMSGHRESEWAERRWSREEIGRTALKAQSISPAPHIGVDARLSPSPIGPECRIHATRRSPQVGAAAMHDATEIRRGGDLCAELRGGKRRGGEKQSSELSSHA